MSDKNKEIAKQLEKKMLETIKKNESKKSKN